MKTNQLACRPDGRMLSRLVARGALASLPFLALAGPAVAAESADEASSTVSTGAESWYQTLPVSPCSSPVGCPPAPAPSALSPYTAGTLHVGVSGGQESARAYIKLDLTTLPADAELRGGSLALPVSSDQQAGNVSVATAKLRGCLVTGAVTDGVEGGTENPPRISCSQAQSPAVLAADSSTFSIDLKPFLDAWSSGVPNQGITLVPADPQEQGAAWQVSLTGKRAQASPRISGLIRFTLPTEPRQGAEPNSSERPPAAPQAAQPLNAPLPLMPQGPMLVPPLVTSVPTPSTLATPGTQPRPAALRTLPWYRYRGVVYLPLLFLVGTLVLVRTLAQPIGAAQRTTAPFAAGLPVENRT